MNRVVGAVNKELWAYLDLEKQNISVAHLTHKLKKG